MTSMARPSPTDPLTSTAIRRVILISKSIVNNDLAKKGPRKGSKEYDLYSKNGFIFLSPKKNNI